jgi:hypothetical protein
MYLNIIEALHNKPTPGILLEGEKMKIFPLGPETRLGCLQSTLLFKIIIKVLDKA